MENAGAIFYFENSVGDKGIEALMAHEIAHQWFGDAVTETAWQHLWLSEGFATYMAHLYLESRYGADTLKKGLEKDRMKVIAFEKERATPVVDTTVTGNYMQLLNANSYEKGGWVLHMLHRQLGDTVFWKGIDNYFAAYKNRNANTGDFERVMEFTSGRELRSFFRQWLYAPGHPGLQITWNYDPDKKMLSLQVIQKQNGLFEFPLEYSVDGTLHTVLIKDRTTFVQISVSVRPSSVIMDPDINLLADFSE
jgi:aminopeptidase N